MPDSLEKPTPRPMMVFLCTHCHSTDLEIQPVPSYCFRCRACGGGTLNCRFTHVYTDGPAPYYTYTGKYTAGAYFEQQEAIKSAASNAIIEAGGSITHHHAVGRIHRPWYDRQRPDLFSKSLRAIKKVCDPSGILNPGVLID